jgi:hypothetical protein
MAEEITGPKRRGDVNNARYAQSAARLAHPAKSHPERTLKLQAPASERKPAETR